MDNPHLATSGLDQLLVQAEVVGMGVCAWMVRQ